MSTADIGCGAAARESSESLGSQCPHGHWNKDTGYRCCLQMGHTGPHKTRWHRGDLLPDDQVCACLDETGSRQVRLYERCQRCGAFMEADYLIDEWADARIAEGLVPDLEAALEQIAGAGATEMSFLDARRIARAALDALTAGSAGSEGTP